MSRIPDVLARRIDRLAGRIHCFHRYAHHPLCESYASEVWRIGRTRICRGCSWALLGALAGLLLGQVLPRISYSALFFLMVLAGLGGALVGAKPVLRSLGKVVTRFLPTLLGLFLISQGLRHGGLSGFLMSAGVGFGFLAAWARYRRQGPWRGACERCPERGAVPCSGFRRQLRREQAFQRVASRILGASRQGE